MTAALAALMGALRVGVAFHNEPTDDPTAFTWATAGTVGAAGQWTDITQYCYGYETSDRGRQHDLQEVEAGELTLNLDNTDSRFSPWYTAGPYAGLLAPKKWVRVEVNVGGTYYPRFTGHVSAWAPQWNDPFTTQCQIQAYDPCRLWNSALLVSNAYAQQVLADGAIGYWRMDDVVASVAADASGNNEPATYTGGATPLQPSLLLVDGDNSVTINSGVTEGDIVSQYVSLPLSASYELNTAAQTLEFWFSTSSAPLAAEIGPFLWNTPCTNTPLGLQGCFLGLFNTTAEPNGIYLFTPVLASAVSPKVTNSVLVASGTWWDGNPHHMVTTFTPASGGTFNVAVYMDGVLTGSVAAVSFNTPPDPVQVGTSQYGFVGNVDEIAWYPSALTAAQVANHYSLGIAGMVQQSTDQRIAACAQVIGWAQTAMDLDSGAVTCQANTEDITQTSALTMAQQAEATEGGGASLYFTADGKLRFVNRRNTWQ